MSHRTQITLSDAQYARLKREPERTGVELAKLVRRALAEVYGEVDHTDIEEALDASFGAWRDRDIDGEEYIEQLRTGMALSRYGAATVDQKRCPHIRAGRVG